MLYGLGSTLPLLEAEGIPSLLCQVSRGALVLQNGKKHLRHVFVNRAQGVHGVLRIRKAPPATLNFEFTLVRDLMHKTRYRHTGFGVDDMRHQRCTI